MQLLKNSAALHLEKYWDYNMSLCSKVAGLVIISNYTNIHMHTFVM